MIEAQRAYELGIVNKVCKAEELLEEAKNTLRRIARNGPLAVKVAKELVNRGLETSQEEGEELEISAWANMFASFDQKEGMGAFLEKRPPQFKGK